MNVEEAQGLGIFVTGLMKKYADGIGGDTVVVFNVPGCGSWVRMSQEKVNAMEAEFPPKDAELQLAAYWAVRFPAAYSATRNEKGIAELMQKLKRSISQTSEDEK